MKNKIKYKQRKERIKYVKWQLALDQMTVYHLHVVKKEIDLCKLKTKIETII